jgi:hypothetical protein
VKDVVGMPAALLNTDNWAAAPIALLQAVVATARARLVGRPIAVHVGGFDAVMTLRDVVVAPGSLGVVVGQLDDVHLVADDVQWRGQRIERVTIACRNVHLRPGLGLILVSAPVEITLVIADDDIDGWLADYLRHVHLWVGKDKVARAALAKHPRLGYIELDHVLDGDDILLRPRKIIALGRRLPARWLPERRIRKPDLPPGMRVQDVRTGEGQVIVELAVDTWRYRLSPWLLTELLRRVARAQDELDVPVAAADPVQPLTELDAEDELPTV